MTVMRGSRGSESRRHYPSATGDMFRGRCTWPLHTHVHRAYNIYIYIVRSCVPTARCNFNCRIKAINNSTLSIIDFLLERKREGMREERRNGKGGGVRKNRGWAVYPDVLLPESLDHLPSPCATLHAHPPTPCVARTAPYSSEIWWVGVASQAVIHERTDVP